MEVLLAQAGEKGRPVEIFFRADDIGPVDDNFRRLMTLFRQHRFPLCLAVVPAWLTGQRWRRMEEFGPCDPLWCWHQHGWDHTSHQRSGRKSEFGDQRSRQAIRSDLVRGRSRLEELLGPAFFPVFTPPWNRCSLETLELLAELDYAAVSRTPGARPSAGALLPDLAVGVDLHTRKETDPDRAWDNLLQEFARGCDAGRIGIMIHHQLMNDRGLAFLDMLLTICRRHTGLLRPCTFRDMLPPR